MACTNDPNFSYAVRDMSINEYFVINDVDQGSTASVWINIKYQTDYVINQNIVILIF